MVSKKLGLPSNPNDQNEAGMIFTDVGEDEMIFTDVGEDELFSSINMEDLYKKINSSDEWNPDADAPIIPYNEVLNILENVIKLRSPNQYYRCF